MLNDTLNDAKAKHKNNYFNDVCLELRQTNEISCHTRRQRMRAGILHLGKKLYFPSSILSMLYDIP